jgi:hypothetical protein
MGSEYNNYIFGPYQIWNLLDSTNWDKFGFLTSLPEISFEALTNSYCKMFNIAMKED